ncbi:transcriptional regulator, LacI family, partial [mine drainage metagenome]
QLVQTGNFEFAEGLECARRILDCRPRPTAIFASNDDMAAAAVSAARQMSLVLPRQLSVVGFDDAPVATMVWPQLTTVRQPVREHRPRRRRADQPVPAAPPGLAPPGAAAASAPGAGPARLDRPGATGLLTCDAPQYSP